jgi:serine/threonine-protein kinase
MIGSVVGNYKITSKIGEGGMGAVFKGIDLMLEREVAIKVLRPEFSSQPELVERFRSEAVTLAKLNHPNIATLHSFFRQNDDFFMVMEFVRGETLDSVIRRTGAMNPTKAVELFNQALDGIGRAHRLGIIHRDIKPANMMLAHEDGSIKVMDFGIARVLGTARMTRQGNIIGTIEYMSPEAIQGQDVDARSDIYSLGILLYEMLTGRIPFTADTEFSLMMAQINEAPPPPRTFAPGIPLPIEQAIMRSLAKKPTARFQAVVDFRSVLEQGIEAAATRPLVRETVPEVPPTRLGSTSAPSYPPSAQPQPVTSVAGSNLPAGNQPPETRLAQSTPVPAYTPVQQPVAQPVQYQDAQPSFLSRLNWKHYATAAVVLVVLLASPFVIVSFMEPAPDNKPSTETQVTQPNQNPTPAETKVSPSAPNPGSQPTAIPTVEPSQPRPAIEGIPMASSEENKAKPERKDSAAAAREKARRRAEAKRLLDQ